MSNFVRLQNYTRHITVNRFFSFENPKFMLLIQEIETHRFLRYLAEHLTTRILFDLPLR